MGGRGAGADRWGGGGFWRDKRGWVRSRGGSSPGGGWRGGGRNLDWGGRTGGRLGYGRRSPG